MSKKRKRGGQNTAKSVDGSYRKHKTVKYAEKTLEKRKHQNSPMGNFDESGGNSPQQALSNVADKKKQHKKSELANRKSYSKQASNSANSEKQVSANLPDLTGRRKQFAKEKYAEKAIQNRQENTFSEPAQAEPPMYLDEEKELEIPFLPQTENKSEKSVVKDPLLAERLKKAAYIKENLEKENLIDTLSSTEEQETEKAETSDKEDIPEEDTKEPQETEQAEIEDIPEYVPNNGDKENYIKDFSQSQYTDRRKNRQHTSSGVNKAAEFTSEMVSAVQSGNVAEMISMPVKYALKDKLPEIRGMKTAKKVSGAVQNSDGVGSAAASVGMTFAVDRTKQYVFRKFSGTPEIHVKRKKYRFIDRKADNFKSIERKANSVKKFVEQKFNKERIKRKKKGEIFKKKNKDVLAKTTKSAGKYLAKGKLTKKLISFAIPLFLPLFIVLILIIAVCSLFSWVSPFEYSLAGDESEEPQKAAETEAEILDGYTLMEQNFLDVSQAYYYLNYGDWYGGTYFYPSAAEEISFADFFAQKCEYIIKTIQAQFASALANARTPEEAAAIGRAMSEAISHALMQAQAEAESEYLALIEGLDDCLSAEEERLHYEVKNNGGSNGIPDPMEFNGMPIKDTNHFDQYEIQSDLSAEELVALTALYKTLVLVQTNGETEDGSEYNVNITPDDIMTFTEETEFIPITTEVTHNNFCTNEDCRRRIIGDYENGYEWEYYCNGDHDDLSGEIGNSPAKDDLIDKIMELTEAEENGFDKEQCKKMLDEYIRLICDELDISESNFRHFGAADSERAKEFYETLIDPAKGSIPNNYWDVQTPID